MRYEALLGFNTKQLWIYDSKNDTYIDPPTEVLNEVKDDEGKLMEIANAIPEPEWLHDGNEYDAETTDI